ncbi:MAG: hypothetical protein ACI89L_000177 [Phycisphaerales bacterium]|jgi:hypothetical protein
MSKLSKQIKGLKAYKADLANAAACTFGATHHVSKLRQIRALAKKTSASSFIEAGTFRGYTTAACAPHFDRVATIEIEPKLHAAAQVSLSKHKNIECVLGDVLDTLPQLMARPEMDRVLIFLDGHYSHGETGMGTVEEPACEAIELLAPFADKIAALVVDDFRMFGSPDWPKRSELLAAIETHLPDLDFTIHLDQLVAWRQPKHGG